MPRSLLSDGRWSELAGLLANRYAFRALVGEGGAGAVFEVANLALGRIEALKILDEAYTQDAEERFKVEARVAASLDHPRIVKIYEVGRDGGWLWYTMQLVDGPTLASVLDAGHRFDPCELARVAVPILDALAYSHERGVVHRDIKPANILFSPQGRPFLTDYGIAKAMENPMDTRTGQVLGTPAYLAPEQALGEPVDARADLYALGVSLYRAAAGVLPFRGEGVMQTLLVRLREDPPPLAGLCPSFPPGLAEVVMRALARNREERWGSAQEMKAALLKACADAELPWDGTFEAAGAFPPQRRPLPTAHGELRARGPEPTADLPRPRRRLLWAVPALLVLGGLLALLPRRHPAPAPPPAAAAAPPVLPEPPPAPPKQPVAARLAPPPEAPPMPHRVVTYPQLLDDGLVPAWAPGCGGMTVDVSLRVGEDGLVKSCKVLGAVAPACAQAARDAAVHYRFRPALDAEGKPVEATVAAAVDFKEAP